MLQFLYTLGIYAYGLAIWLVAPFNRKAGLWISGRRGWQTQLAELQLKRPVWVHCASLGEFEQGRPIIEAIRQQHPGVPIVLTFFSPSGYELRKNYDQVDAVLYLPLDTPGNARRFVRALQPRLALFIKYELWLNTLAELRRANIPHALVAANLSADSSFLSGGLSPLYREALAGMTQVFVQRRAQVEQLHAKYGWPHVQYSGDPRADRVAHIVDHTKPDTFVADFVGDAPCVVCGSTWPKDEALIAKAWHALPEAQRPTLVIAPHELGEAHLAAIESRFPGETLRYSSQTQSKDARVLIIDNIGMLAGLYTFTHFAYVGGGFGAGIHNTLEPAAHGVGVCFGPRFQQFAEAQDLLASHAAAVINTSDDLRALLAKTVVAEPAIAAMGAAAQHYVAAQRGATARVVQWLNDLEQL